MTFHTQYVGKFGSVDMYHKIRRRRFGQLVFISTAVTVFGNLAKKTLAQEPHFIYGARAVSPGVVLQSLDLKTGKIKDLSDRTKGLTVDADERLTGLTLLTDKNTLVLATAPTKSVTTRKPVKHSRIGKILTSPQTLAALPGLDEKSTVETILATNEGKLLSIVSLKQGAPPFRIVNIDLQTSQASFIDDLDQLHSGNLPPPGAFVLPPHQRFSNLTQSPDGTIYATSSHGREGFTRLVKINLQQRQLLSLPQLSFNNHPWLNDVSSLAFSPEGQLYALGDPNHQGSNSLFTVDVSTGVMKLVGAFAVDKITFTRP